MASLTHVCMWSNQGWKQISAEEAAKLHPGGTVSAHSGLFMCELCGQYVTLTDGSIQARHFRHRADEDSKDCPERTFGTGYISVYDPKEHDLPIRLIVSPSSFQFEIGLLRVPTNFNEDFCVMIQPIGSNICYKYLRERLNCDRTTYLYIGDRPFESYMIQFCNGDDTLQRFWPGEVRVVRPSGTLFEKDSGRKIPHDGDVEADKEYYLLIRDVIQEKPIGSVRIREVMKKQFDREKWILYTVSASTLDEEAAKFFLRFRCRLTNRPISLRPIWPLYVDGNYIVKHSNNSMYMLAEGNVAEVTSFPCSKIQLKCNLPQTKLYKVICSARQQLITAGRTHALQYTYYWKEALSQEGVCPEVLVTDLSENPIASGEANTLPRNKTLQFRSSFDGELIISHRDKIVEKRKMPAGMLIEVDGVSYGSTIQALIGLDIIWQIEFKKQSLDDKTSDSACQR